MVVGGLSNFLYGQTIKTPGIIVLGIKCLI